MARRKLKLYGKKATPEDILEEINRLLYAKGNRPYSLRPTEIAKTLGISRKTVYNYIKKLSKRGDTVRLPSGHFFFPKSDEFREFNKHHEITSDPMISEWMDDLLTRKQGLPVKTWRNRLRSVEIVCNTCKVSPYDLTISTKKTEKILRTFAKHFQNGNVVCSNRGRKSLGMNTTVYNKVQAVRDFCSFYDITWRKGISGIMSQKVPNHGKYADIRFTSDEFDGADKFIKDRWGLDSDVYRWFWVGIESCARLNALYHMKNDWSKLETKSGGTVFLMSAIESKTENIRGGKWTKFITRRDTQTSLELLRARYCGGIHESKLPEYLFKNKINDTLREIYRHLGKNEFYFKHHPSHALRHLGAHYWLEKTNYNYGIPAWVKGVANFWVKGNISDSEFGDSISFLIEQKIIKVDMPENDDFQNISTIRNLEVENKKLEAENKKLKKENSRLNNLIDDLLGTSTTGNTNSYLDYSEYLDNGCHRDTPHLWSDGYCYESSEPSCSTTHPYYWSDGFCYKSPEYLDNGCHSNYPYYWSDGLCHTTPESKYTPPTNTTPTCDESYPDVCIAPYPPDLDCDEIGYSNFRVTGIDLHGFDTDYDGIGCEVGSPDSSNTVESTPTCDPSYPDVCIAPYPPDLNCGDIGYSNFRVIGSDPHGFDGDNDGIGCES